MILPRWTITSLPLRSAKEMGVTVARRAPAWEELWRANSDWWTMAWGGAKEKLLARSAE